MAKNRAPQDYDALDITISTTDKGHVFLWVGEHYTDKEGVYRPGMRAFHLCTTDPERRTISAAFMKDLVEKFNEAMKIKPVTVATAPKQADAHVPDWRKKLDEARANNKNGPVQTSKASDPDAAILDALKAR